MPTRDPSSPVPGTLDLHEPSLAALRQAEDNLRRFLASYGYGSVEVPLLEHTELYLRKLGSLVTGHMFTLIDQQGERLCLRPEFTGSVIRSYITVAAQRPLPVRWQYTGPVFRDQDRGDKRLRQFTQLGAEIIGAGSAHADAELLTLAVKGMQVLGLPRPRVVIGHAGLVPKLLDGFRLSERVKMYMGRHLELLREGAGGMAALREGLDELRVVPAATIGKGDQVSSAADAGEVAGLVRWLMDEGTARPTGRRTTEEILQRFQAKLQTADNPQHMEQAIALAAELAPVCAAPSQALAEGRAIAKRYGLSSEPLEELQRVVDLFMTQSIGDTSIQVDLGLTRPLGYYTGIVFELYLDGDNLEAVGGGGRYDSLVRALGGDQDVPALGFAYTLEHLVACLPQARNDAIDDANSRVLVVPETAGDFTSATQYADSLRAQGLTAIVDVNGMLTEVRKAFCDSANIGRVIIVNSTSVREEKEASYAPAGAP